MMQKPTLAFLFSTAILLSTPALAASPFDGSWKADLNTTEITSKPYELRLKDGIYHCGLCAPAYDVKADGQLHPVKGHDYFDTVSVKVIDAHNVLVTEQKAGKTIETTNWTVSADGKTLNFTFTDNSGATPVKGAGADTRAAAGPAGAHAISGQWKMNKLSQISDNGFAWTFKTDGDKLSFSSANGQSYTATFGGPAVPIKGDPGNTMVTVKKLNATTLVETDLRKGKVVGIQTLTLAADGKSMTSVYEDKEDGRTYKITARRQ